MIQECTILKSADNTGAKLLRCFHIFGGYKKRFAQLGDVIKVSVIEAQPHSSVKKGEIYHAVVVRQVKEKRRSNGVYIKFEENACVLIDPKNKMPKGTRIFGPIPKELRERGYQKIVSLAPEVL
ncbi:MAG: 50S ribosomal protein L14 [bacterium]